MRSLPHDSSKGIEDTWSVRLKSLKPRHRIREDRSIVINTVTFKMDEIMLNFTVSFFFWWIQAIIIVKSFQLCWQMGPTYFWKLQIPLRSLLQKYVAPKVQTGKETCNFFLSNQLWIKCKNTSFTPRRNCFLKSSFVDPFRIRLSRLCSWMCGTKKSCHNTYHFRKIFPIRKYIEKNERVLNATKTTLEKIYSWKEWQHFAI